jgi:hypothetical protein
MYPLFCYLSQYYVKGYEIIIFLVFNEIYSNKSIIVNYVNNNIYAILIQKTEKLINLIINVNLIITTLVFLFLVIINI